MRANGLWRTHAFSPTCSSSRQWALTTLIVSCRQKSTGRLYERYMYYSIWKLIGAKLVKNDIVAIGDIWHPTLIRYDHVAERGVHNTTITHTHRCRVDHIDD